MLSQEIKNSSSSLSLVFPANNSYQIVIPSRTILLANHGFEE